MIYSVYEERSEFNKAADYPKLNTNTWFLASINCAVLYHWRNYHSFFHFKKQTVFNSEYCRQIGCIKKKKNTGLDLSQNFYLSEYSLAHMKFYTMLHICNKKKTGSEFILNTLNINFPGVINLFFARCKNYQTF